MLTEKTSALTTAATMQMVKDALWKFTPRAQLRNPVMFVVYVGSLLSTGLALQALWQGADNAGFVVTLTAWLWFTLLFANFAEAYAEGKSKAQAASLKELKQTVSACRLRMKQGQEQQEIVASSDLRINDVVYVQAGELVPMDGEVIEGVASVDESAITGESAPVIRAAGSDFCSVTGGTRLVSDWLKVRINANPGESFIDQMIGMVEGAKRQKTPNEVALTIVLVTLTVIFLMVVATLLPFSVFAATVGDATAPLAIVSLIALLVCLIPTTIGGLLSAIGVAGMSRMMAKNVVAKSGRAVETAGNIDVLLLDKTGTITFGNRQASAFYPAVGIRPADFAEKAWLASQADETPEGRSIVALAQIKQPELTADALQQQWPALTAVPFTAQTRMSGVDIEVDSALLAIRKGASQAIKAYVEAQGASFPSAVQKQVDFIAAEGATPLVVAVGDRVIGCLALKDVVKPNMSRRFAQLREMGIKTVMITGDNPLTAAAIASEAGVDDYLAEATPENKLNMIRSYQQQGLLVAMTGDGTNDAPALAQADVAVAMNSGTQAAKEAGNMVDMDSDPTKLIEVVQTGKQLLMTRGALTTFSIANDVAKYFAIIPALFTPLYPQLAALNVMGLHSPESAILAAVIFNALIIIALIPLAMKGVRYRALSAVQLLRQNVFWYGLGGLVVPFIGIKLIDVVLTWMA